jgi:uncharacterized protein (TIGR02391 family)
MSKPGKQTDVSKMLADRFPRVFQILKQEGKLHNSGIREFELHAIYSLLNKNLLSTALVLFLGFSHGDSYPISSIVEVFERVDEAQIAKILQNLKAKGLVYVEKFGDNWDFYALDKGLLVSAINNFKQNRFAGFKFDKETVNSLYYALRLHPRIRKASESLFKTGHYAQAIFEAFKCIEVMVREKSRVNDKDGQALMADVFNENRPTLRLNQLQTTSEKDEQIGFKFIFMGAMTGIRNPKAHDLVEQRNPYRTLEYLALASLLAKRVEEATYKVPFSHQREDNTIP